VRDAGPVSPTLLPVAEWPDPVERVASFLRESGAEARLEEFASETPTARDAARAAGCDLAQIVKSVVFDCGDRYVVVLTPGDRRADAAKVAAAAGCARARVATRAQVVEATGFAPGAVAPFPLKAVERMFIDQTLLTHDTVWVGAGSERHLAALAPPELVRLTHAQAIDAVERLPEPGGVSGSQPG
jgi:prolyl-tRNA editing enzyme YbaK/EbsC (Cys-tRNA(Pro) deacylase)